MSTRVEVVVTCHDDGRFLEEAIASLDRERQEGSGVIIVNDGSTDAGTLNVLQQLRARGFRVIDQPNLGLPSARNTGWRASDAPYILFLDADNRLEAGFATKAVEQLEANGAAVAYPDKQEFGLRNARVPQRMPGMSDLLVGNRIDACVVVRRDVLAAVDGFDEALRDGYEDWELWIRLLAAGHAFVHVRGSLFHYRVREDSLRARMDDPEARARTIAHITRKHDALFTAHASAIVTELHRIQAHDHGLIAQAEQLLARERNRREEEQEAATQRQEDVARVHQRERAEGAEREAALRVAIEALRIAQAEAVTRHEVAEQALLTTREEKDRLSTEAHRLVGEVDKALRALDVQRDHARALQALIGQYEERIKAIESTRLWRMRRAWYKMRALLRTGSDTSRRGFKWLRRITFLISGKGRGILRKFLAKVFKALYLWTEVRPVRIVVGEEQAHPVFASASSDPYERWMATHFARPADLAAYREDVAFFAFKPLVSVVMPVYDPPVALLDAAIRSVVDQSYPHWELCIADDNSSDASVREALTRWMKADERIKVVFRPENGHISKASNSALELAQGEFTALMDHDDLLAPDALHHVVKALNRDRALDLVYTDEDKIDEQGRHSEPHFKPQWCPDHLLSRNYFGHLVVLRTAILKDIGGFRAGFEGSQDYDLLLRFTERSQRIARVPRVLYHWRIHSASAARSEEVKPYAYDAAKRALGEALVRRKEPAEVSFLSGFRGYGIRFTRPLEGKVSVIIPTKDKTEVLGTCLRSLFALTDHPDFDVLVLSNNSRERALFTLLEDMKQAHPERFNWHAHDVPFNFSALMNEGARRTNGQHILYLNNDTEIIHADWMRAMHEWSQRPTVGAVGAKLLYHNDTIQHAGVVIGLGGVAGHTFTGTHKDGPGYFNYVNTINNYSAVTAACLMVERKKLEAIGGWEERFTVEYNDVDLCLRLREHGWNNVYLPHVSLYHYESLTRGHPHMTKESYERHLREVGLFQERWAAYVEDDPCYNPNLTRGAHDWRLDG
ncbi:MAG TPA: glycosyltransferase [Flavobacteriales bacterium]|jgi:glycosyltransferase involved in cell wall biosynthesis|nr:glycosyltransferase [Flavobacteriales bacterium]